MGQRPDRMSGRGLLWGSGLLLRVIATGAGLCFAAVALASADGLVPNPANHRTLVGKPIEDFRYDQADRCRDQVPKGMKALQTWLERNVRGESWGITRCERLSRRLNSGAARLTPRRRDNFSVHAEGQAIDWHLDAGVPKERRAAMRLIRTLLAKDRNDNPAALARRMGVQGLIFDCKAWWSGMDGLGQFSYCYKRGGDLRNDLDRTQAHRDHVHLELNWPGARKQTSFWHSRVSRR